MVTVYHTCYICSKYHPLILKTVTSDNDVITEGPHFSAVKFCWIPRRNLWNSAALFSPNILHSVAIRRCCINWQHFEVYARHGTHNYHKSWLTLTRFYCSINGKIKKEHKNLFKVFVFKRGTKTLTNVAKQAIPRLSLASSKFWNNRQIPLCGMKIRVLWNTTGPGHITRRLRKQTISVNLLLHNATC